MITVEYVITKEYGEWRSVTGDGKSVKFKLGTDVNGILSLGGREAEVYGGCCVISTAGLAHGQYAPTLVTEDGTLELEPIILAGERIYPAPTGEAVRRYALRRLLDAENKLKKLEERIDELESKINGTALFE